MAARSRPKNKKRRVKSTRKPRRGFPWLRLLLLLLVVLGGYVAYVDYTVRGQFEGKRWALPARVYARPLELYAGLPMEAARFADELARLRYRKVGSVSGPGEVSRNRDTFHLVTRPFAFWDGAEASRRLRVEFSGGYLTALQDIDSRRPVDLARLDPQRIGSIYPSHNEDRVLVRLDEVPPRLTQMLIGVEDRRFYSHHGISFRGIARASLANLRAGRLVQGGSTLTQQLVKNFFLSNERTLRRKLNEALMAPLLEWHYSKQEILEAYLNEVYLGQDGLRGVHGFGLASLFYFERPLGELSLDQMALLVALVKGASYYDPRRHPERARARRDLVLDVALEQGIASESEVQKARVRPLGVSPRRPGSVNAYPAFLDLVRRQLRRDYREEDITSEGLRIFTTLDPQVQVALEAAFKKELPPMERREGLPADSLQGAGVVTTTEGGEVLAVVGDSQPRFSGFNRALDTARPVGSVIKPAVYLSALARPTRYSLASLLDDGPLTVEDKHGEAWTPQNYDMQFHGQVPLYQALAKSYNVSTARLGLELGVTRVVDTLHQLGVERELKPYPSLLLGAVGLSPLEVTQFYQTLSSGGFHSPLRAIRAVLAADGAPLQRYPLTVDQAFAPAPVFLVNSALQAVVREGTARSLGQRLPPGTDAAGKTGTTDDLRDSWFAGFTGDRLAVIWLGRDDNQPINLTGASGAMRVWGEMMAALAPQPLILTPPEDVEYKWVDPVSGLWGDEGCPGAVQLPFIQGSGPTATAPCAGSLFDGAPGESGTPDWFRRLFR